MASEFNSFSSDFPLSRMKKPPPRHIYDRFSLEEIKKNPSFAPKQSETGRKQKEIQKEIPPPKNPETHQAIPPTHPNSSTGPLSPPEISLEGGIGTFNHHELFEDHVWENAGALKPTKPQSELSKDDSRGVSSFETATRPSKNRKRNPDETGKCEGDQEQVRDEQDFVNSSKIGEMERSIYAQRKKNELHRKKSHLSGSEFDKINTALLLSDIPPLSYTENTDVESKVTLKKSRMLESQIQPLERDLQASDENISFDGGCNQLGNGEKPTVNEENKQENQSTSNVRDSILSKGNLKLKRPQQKYCPGSLSAVVRRVNSYAKGYQDQGETFFEEKNEKRKVSFWIENPVKLCESMRIPNDQIPQNKPQKEGLQILTENIEENGKEKELKSPEFGKVSSKMTKDVIGEMRLRNNQAASGEPLYISRSMKDVKRSLVISEYRGTPTSHVAGAFDFKNLPSLGEISLLNELNNRFSPAQGT